MQIQTTLAILTILTVGISAIVGLAFGATAPNPQSQVRRSAAQLA